MTHETPETVRAATYLKAQDRFDLRGFKATNTGKTRRGKLKCKPPNKPCGKRCIPPNWDCRLKGEGTNSELNVHKSDPLAGIASIQRGVTNLRRGVTTLNPAQIQRGRSAVIRGVVKLTPGDNLEQKKRLRKSLTQKTTPVMAVLGVTVVGMVTHGALKRSFPQYRDGWGADVDRSAARGVDSFLDNAPFFGARRAATRAAGAAAVQGIGIAGLRDMRIQRTQAMAQGNTRGLGPLSFRTRMANTDGSYLRDQLQELNRTTRERGLSYEQWKQASVEQLYSATSKGTRPGLQARGSIFSEHAANEFLVSKFGLANDGNTAGYVGSGRYISMAARNAHVEGLLTSRLSSWGDDMRQDMRLRRMTGPNGEITTDQVNRYIEEIGNPQLNTRYTHLTPGQQTALRNQSHDLMRIAITGDRTSLRRQAQSMRRSLVDSYDQYFEESARYMRRNANASDSPFGDGTVGLARYINSRSRSSTQRTGQVFSRSHADLMLRAHYHRNVMELRTSFTISDNTARRIAQEISRSAELPDVDAAFSILQSNGFPMVVRGNTTRPRGRTDAKEATRLGKPCGASHIPKAHNCKKGNNLQIKTEQVASTATPPSNKSKISNPRVIAGALAATAVVGAGLYVANDMRRVAKQELMFAPSPGIKDTIRRVKKESGLKNGSQAMGKYYTEQSGLKPGDVVYYRKGNDPAAHFGVYLGEGKDGKVRAVMANTNDKRVGFVDVFEIGTTKPEIGYADHFMLPVLVKAPSIKGLKRRTNEETVQRALRTVGTDYNFTLTKNNCEVLANAIAYDTPKSQQLERFTRITRTVADATIGNRQRIGGTIRRLKGQKKGKALTAKQILSRLNKDDSTFISPEGKLIAKQHYSMFFQPGVKLDAVGSDSGIGDLLSPEEVWKKLAGFSEDAKAIAIRDYLLLVRLAQEPASAPA